MRKESIKGSKVEKKTRGKIQKGCLVINKAEKKGEVVK
jgi:hypothetical protein